MASTEAPPPSRQLLCGRFRRRLAVHGRRAPPLESDLALECMFRESSSESEEEEVQQEEEYDDGGFSCMVPLFFDDMEEALAADEAEAAVKAEKQRREAEQKARTAEEEKRRAEERKRLAEEAVWRRKKHRDVLKSIRRYNPKTRCVEYTRFPFVDLSSFNLDEPSPILAMRHTDKNRGSAITTSVNILSIKIISSDKGFPVNVYGSIIARDDLDHKCVHLFCRPSRMDSELINSEDQSLILTCPSRGFVLTDFLYIEVDLKMKRDRGKDKQFSIGLLDIDGRMAPLEPTTEVRCLTMDSSLSTVEMRYAVVNKAVEATVEFKLLQGDFYGKITAHTTRIEHSIQDRIVLHDSRTCGAVAGSGNSRIIQLLRRVVAVSVNEKLVLTILPQAGDAQYQRFAPFLRGAQQDVIKCGAVKLAVKVTWSIIDICP